jgi:hypothetical protein
MLTFEMASLKACKDTFEITRLEIRVSRSDTYQSTYTQMKNADRTAVNS